MIYTLPGTNVAPENIVSQKESCFHTSIFEGLVSFRESNGDQKIILHQYPKQRRANGAFMSSLDDQFFYEKPSLFRVYRGLYHPAMYILYIWGL